MLSRRESGTYTLQELAHEINARIVGDDTLSVTGLATLQNATSSELSFLANPAYAKYLEGSQAGAVIVKEDDSASFAGTKLIHPNPYLAYASLTRLWSSLAINTSRQTSVHPSAIIAPSAKLGVGVVIGAGAVLDEGVALEDFVHVGPNCTIGRDSCVGAKSFLHAGVTIYHGVTLGKECIIHSGVVLGSDGFGFAPTPDGWLKIEQLGGVVIEDKVEIGANTTIDRGALDNTLIRRGVILDNQIQVAHNVVIGENTAIAACSAIAGSTTIGKNCIIGGASGIAGHLEIADGVHITAMTMVIKSLREPGVYSSGTGVQPNDQWRKSIARLRQLDKMAGRLKQLEKRLNEISEES